MQDTLDEIRKLAKFLNVPENEELFRAIDAKCRFEKMKEEKKYAGSEFEKHWKQDFSVFRRGKLLIDTYIYMFVSLFTFILLFCA